MSTNEPATVPANLRFFYADHTLQITWDAASVPAGVQVVLEFLDAQGSMLSPQPALAYPESGRAIVQMPVKGRQYWLRARVESSSSPVLTVIVHNQPPVSNVTTSWSQGALHVSWLAPPGPKPDAYEGRLLDSSATPISPQPEFVAEQGGFSTDGSALVQGETYIASVRAVRDNSYSHWANGAPYLLNEKLPDSVTLRQLLARLSAAITASHGSFLLTPEMVNDSAVSNLFGELLGNDGDTIALRDALVASTPSSVTLTGLAEYPFSTASSTFLFTANNEQLALLLTSDDLGSFAVTRLLDYGFIPPSTFNPSAWAGGLAQFPRLTLTLNSQTNTVTLGGQATASSWNVPVGLTDVSFETVTPDFQVTAATESEPKSYQPQVKTRLNVGSSLAIPVLLRVPVATSGWLVGLDAPDGFAIGDLANLNPLMSGANSGLPQSLIDLRDFRITALSLDFLPAEAPALPQLWHLNAGLRVGPQGSGAPWRVVNGLITINDVGALIDETLYITSSGLSASTVASINGSFALTDQLNVEIGIQSPAAGGMLLTGSAEVDDFSLSSLASYMGGSIAPLADFMSKLGTVGTLGLRSIDMLFDNESASPTINAMSVGLALSSWTIPALSWFVIDQVSLDLNVDLPLSSATVTGQLIGDLTLGGIPLSISFDFTEPDRWSLSLNSTAAQLDSLAQIAAVIPTDMILAFLPSGLQTTVTYGLEDFTIVYDTASSYVESATFKLHSSIGWTWPVGTLTLWDIEIDLLLSKTSASDLTGELSGSLSGSVTVGGVDLRLSATKTQPSDWTFSGELDTNLVIDFNAVLQQLLPSYRLPSGYGFPTSIILEVASLTVTPATGKTDFYGQASLDWSVGFGLATLALRSLGGEVHLAGVAGETTGMVVGDFTLGTLNGFGLISLGIGTADLIVNVEVSTGTSPDARSAIDSIIGADSYEAVPTPASFLKPNYFANASLSVNVTRRSLLLAGQFGVSGEGDATAPRYAALVLLIQPKPNTNPDQLGFVLAAALEQWTLADISPVLTGLDSAIGLNLGKAAVALSLLDDAAGALVSANIPAIPSALPVRPGLNFYIELDFDGGLLRNVQSIVSLQGPYTISGYIPADTTVATALTVTLGQLTLLNALSFQNVVLNYTITPAVPATTDAPAALASSELKLSGQIVAHLDQDYYFDGDLFVTSAAAHFSVVTANSVIHPLGIPALTLDALGFEVSLDYADAEPTNVWLAFFGQVSFAPGPTLKGLVALQNGSPAIVFIKLTTPTGTSTTLSIGTLFSQVTMLTWPNVLDLSLREGQLWWVPGTQGVTLDGILYAAGFHASAVTNIFFLPEITLDVAVYSEATATQPAGLVASAAFTNPLDWGFIKFTGTQAHGGHTAGPWVTINTNNAALPFGLGAGIELFSTFVGDVEISVGTEEMTGTITLPDSAGIFANQQFAFKWEDNEFTVENWPLSGLQLPAFEFTDIQGSGVCSQLVIDSLPVDTEFNLHAGFTILAPDGQNPARLQLTLSGTFDLVVNSSAYSDDPLLTANIAQARLEVPLPDGGSYDWTALADSFVSAIKGAAQSIFENLLQDPQNLAKLAAAQGIKWGLGQALDYLVCRGMTQTAAQAALNAATSAAASTVATGACGGGALVAVGGVVGSIDNDTFVNQSAADPSQPKPGRPIKPRLSFDNNELTINWDGSPTQNVTLFGVSLVGSDKHVPLVPSVSGTSTTVSYAVLHLGKRYKAQIVAAGPGGQSEPSSSSELFILGAPTLDPPVYSYPSLTAHWSAVSRASSYEVEVLDSNNIPLSSLSVKINDTTATISGPTITRAHFVHVRAKAPDVVGVWSNPCVIQLSQLPAPAGIVLRTVGSSVVTQWQSVAGATGYVVLLLDVNDQLLPNPNVSISGTTATITGAGIVDGAEIKVSVLATAPNAVGVPSTSQAFTIRMLPAPNFTAVRYSVPKEGVDAWWTQVETAQGYNLRLADATGVPLSQQPLAEIDGTNGFIQTVGLSIGAIYMAQVMAYNETADSAWSSAPDDLITLPLPYGWSQVSDAGPAGMTSPVALSFRQKLWALAGSRMNSSVYSSEDGRDWQQVTADAPWPCRINAGGFVYLNKLWLLGGVTTSEEKLDDIWSSEDGMNWVRNPAPAPWGARSGLCALAFGSRAWVFGGSDAQQTFYNDVWSTTDGATWTKVIDKAAWEARCFAAAVVFGDCIWLLGGLAPGNTGSLQDVWATGDGVTWTRASDPPWAARMFACAVAIQDRLYLVGGLNQPAGATSYTQLGDMWAYADGQGWTQVDSAGPWSPREQPGVVAQRRTLYLLGGKADGTANNSVWAYRAPSPISPGLFPVLADSVAALINNLVGFQGDNALTGNITFNASNSTIKVAPDKSGFRRCTILASPIPSGFDPDSTIVACSTVPLIGWLWTHEDNSCVGSASYWTEQGWEDTDGSTFNGAAAYSGLYYYKLILDKAKVGHTIKGLLSALDKAPRVAFYSAFTNPARSPLADSFAPFVTGSPMVLIEELFNLPGSNPQLHFGQFNKINSSFTTSPSANNIEFSLGNYTVPCSIASSVVACSTTPLNQWEWNDTDTMYLGRYSIWSDQGWQAYDVPNPGTPTPVRGLYFYRADFDNSQAQGQPNVNIEARDKTSIIAFFTPG